MIQQKTDYIKKMPNWLLQQFQLKPGKPATSRCQRDRYYGSLVCGAS
jgi:hypothetical protein